MLDVLYIKHSLLVWPVDDAENKNKKTLFRVGTYKTK